MILYFEYLEKYISSFTNMVLQARKIAVTCNPCFTKGEVYRRGASELANTNSASKLTCRHKKKPQALPVVFLRRQEARETKGTAKMVYSCAVTGAIKMKKMPHEL